MVENQNLHLQGPGIFTNPKRWDQGGFKYGEKMIQKKNIYIYICIYIYKKDPTNFLETSRIFLVPFYIKWLFVGFFGRTWRRNISLKTKKQKPNRSPSVSPIPDFWNQKKYVVSAKCIFEQGRVARIPMTSNKKKRIHQECLEKNPSQKSHGTQNHLTSKQMMLHDVENLRCQFQPVVFQTTCSSPPVQFLLDGLKW